MLIINILLLLREVWYSSVAKKAWKWIKENPLIFILIAFLLLISGLSIWRMFDMSEMGHYLDGLLGTAENTTNLTSENMANPTSKYQTLRTLGLIIFGIGALLAIAVANRRAEAQFEANKEQRKANKEQRKANETQLQSYETQRQTSRNKIYNDAITHLGHDKPSVRLGGAYALYELSKLDTDKLKNIAEILCAHVRETTQKLTYIKDHFWTPSNEVQSLLNLLSKLNGVYKKKKLGSLLDLSYAHLNGVSLVKANLQRANLRGVKMQEALLRNAKMQGALLSGAQMQGAFLESAKIQGARLFKTNMQGADLQLTQMQAVNLREANLHGANLHKAEMQGAILDNTYMEGAFAIKDESPPVAQIRVPSSFTKRIKKRRNEDTDLKTVVWEGEKKEGDMKKIEEELKKLMQEGKLEEAIVKDIIEKITPHKGKPPKDNVPPKGMITGKLTDEMADKLIKDYKKAIKS